MYTRVNINVLVIWLKERQNQQLHVYPPKIPYQDPGRKKNMYFGRYQGYSQVMYDICLCGALPFRYM